jgi:NTE family protein
MSSSSIPTPQAGKSFFSRVADAVHDTLGLGHAEAAQAPAAAAKAAPEAPKPEAASDQFRTSPGAANPFAGAGRTASTAAPPALPEDPAARRLLERTRGLRDGLERVHTLQRELAGLAPSDPRHAEVKEQLRVAEKGLDVVFGYSSATAPKPGEAWVAPRLMSKSMPDLTFNAKSFPTKRPVTAPPAALDVVFNNRTSVNLLDGAGKPVTVDWPEQYKAFVAQNRAAAGMPRQDGEPVAVHVSLEGGGGKGKRYSTALGEMFRLGVVPASVSGTSAGSIAAGLVAAGATPADLDRFMKDPRITKMYDVDLVESSGGLMKGQTTYELFDQELRRLTGIHDRPVTFADLKIPLQVVAAKMTDSQPPAGQEDMTQAKNRAFVFSQETTPHTPVALAIRASMSIPGVFDPVRVLDPASGRQVTLVDGGVLDNLPMHYHHNDLPVVGVSLAELNSNHPADHTNKAAPLPVAGSTDANHIVDSALHGYRMLKASGGDTDDFQDRTRPKPGQFMLSLPTWNLKDTSQANSTLGFAFDPKVDPALDRQTTAVTQGFFKKFLDKLGVAGASGTNTPAELPAHPHLALEVEALGKKLKVEYSGGDALTCTMPWGERLPLEMGKKAIETMPLDHEAFGDMAARVAPLVRDLIAREIGLRPHLAMHLTHGSEGQQA